MKLACLYVFTKTKIPFCCMPNNMLICFLLLLVSPALASCVSATQFGIYEIPAVPMNILERWDNRGRFRLPFAVYDQRFSIVVYNENGEPDLQVRNEMLFPADTWVVYKDSELKVFLARSPHGGCLVFWDEDRNYFHDPCYGSKFTEEGEYIEGPASRNMDELPARIQNDIVWVTNQLIYGEPIESSGPFENKPDSSGEMH